MSSIRLPVASYNQPSRAPVRLLNCYPQQTVGKQPVELVGAPGITGFCTLGNGPGRGLFVMRGSLYAVSADKLYRITDTGTATELGTTPGSSRLMFAGNGAQILMSNRYLYDGTSVEAVADVDLPPVSAVDFIDGYFVYAISGSGNWGCSQLYDGKDYDPADTANAEGSPDDVVTLKVDHRQVLVFGQQTTEIYWNASGGAGFPFERVAGGVIEYGCLARMSVARQDNSVYWLAHDRTIRRLSELTPVRVSHHGVEEAISRYPRVDDCEAFSHSWNGHLFVTFRFPSANATWVLDCTTGEWHERASYGSNTWDVIDTAECYGKVFVQSASSGAIGVLSDTQYTEFGATLRRSWTYPQVYESNRRLFHRQLELVARTGAVPVGEAPKVLLEISDDGGNTWTAMPSRDLGRTGQHAQVVRWSGLGSARDRVYRMSLDDSRVPLHVVDTTLEVA